MNPNGLVDAASSTSQTSMPIRSKTTLSSFTRAMFTARKMFSVSLVASAARADETRTVSRRSPGRRGLREVAATADRRRRPPWEWSRWKSRLPGSSRSGEKARKKSWPHRRRRLQDPADELVGGARVRGRLEHHELAGRRVAAILPGRRPDDELISGSRCGVSGVGTQIRSASGSEVGRSRRSPQVVRATAAFSAPAVEVLDIAFAARSASPSTVHVEAEHREALLDEREGQRQPDITEAEYAHDGGMVGEAPAGVKCRGQTNPWPPPAPLDSDWVVSFENNKTDQPRRRGQKEPRR